MKRSPAHTDAHLPYWRLLEALQQGDRCALCRIEEDAERQYIDMLAEERVNDPGVRAVLRNSRGFCRRHTELLLDTGHALGVSILMGDQAEAFLRDVDRSGPVKGKPKTFAGRPARRACPACLQVRDVRRRFCTVFIHSLAEEQAAAAWENEAAPLCTVHYRLIRGAADQTTAAQVHAAQRRKLGELRRQLECFCRKQDYRYRHEPLGAERDAWLRAARIIAGPWPIEDDQ